MNYTDPTSMISNPALINNRNSKLTFAAFRAVVPESRSTLLTVCPAHTRLACTCPTDRVTWLDQGSSCITLTSSTAITRIKSKFTPLKKAEYNFIKIIMNTATTAYPSSTEWSSWHTSQRSQWTPLTPGLQRHWPVWGSQESVPQGEQLHSENIIT